MGHELVSRRTRREFREHLVGTTIGYIDDVFRDEGVARSQTGVPVSGQRRERVEQHYTTVDWTSREQVARVLRVYETILLSADSDATTDSSHVEKLKAWLRRDGYETFVDGSIRAIRTTSLLALPTEALRDAGPIHEHLRRLESAVDDDPALAIGQAKSLIEATTKLVLRELGISHDERSDVPALVKLAQRALGLHIDVVAPSKDGFDVIRRVLAGLTQIAVGIAELRNLYGPEHGRSTVTALQPRHAHLAVGCASAYCRMLLETLAEPRAPWKVPTPQDDLAGEELGHAEGEAGEQG